MTNYVSFVYLNKQNVQKLKKSIDLKKEDITVKIEKFVEVAYLNYVEKITKLLGPNNIIPYQNLKSLQVPKVHFEKDCGSDCNQIKTCLRGRETFQYVKLLAQVVGNNNPVFADIRVSVCGSLGEISKAFGVEEVDVNFTMSPLFTDWMFYHPETQTLRVKENCNSKLLLSFCKDKDNSENIGDNSKEIDSEKLFLNFLRGIFKAVSAHSKPEGLTMDPLVTSATHCDKSLDTVWTEPEFKRCHHESNCLTHDEHCDCKVYNKPCLSRTKIGAVLHLQWSEEDGTKYNIDCDINCPNMGIDKPYYDGTIWQAQHHLKTFTPPGWLEEFAKLEDMSAVRGQSHVTPSVRLRRVNKETTFTRQVGPSVTICIKTITNNYTFIQTVSCSLIKIPPYMAVSSQCT